MTLHNTNKKFCVCGWWGICGSWYTFVDCPLWKANKDFQGYSVQFSISSFRLQYISLVQQWHKCVTETGRRGYKAELTPQRLWAVYCPHEARLILLTHDKEIIDVLRVQHNAFYWDFGKKVGAWFCVIIVLWHCSWKPVLVSILPTCIYFFQTSYIDCKARHTV